MLMRLNDRMVTLMIMLTMLMIKTKKKKMMMMTTLMVGLVLVAVMMMMMMMMMMTMIVKPRMFWEERLGKIKFRASPKRVGPRILSLESVDYFGASEHY